MRDHAALKKLAKWLKRTMAIAYIRKMNIARGSDNPVEWPADLRVQEFPE